MYWSNFPQSDKKYGVTLYYQKVIILGQHINTHETPDDNLMIRALYLNMRGKKCIRTLT